MNLNNNYRPVIALSVIGYVFIVLLNSGERILNSLLNIIALITHFPPIIFYSLNVISRLLVLILWIWLIFKLLKGFSWSEKMSENLPRKLVLKFSVIAIILFLVSYGLGFAEIILRPKYHLDYPDEKFTMIISIIYQILGFIQVLIIFFGFYKIINQKSTAANSQHTQLPG